VGGRGGEPALSTAKRNRPYFMSLGAFIFGDAPCCGFQGWKGSQRERQSSVWPAGQRRRTRSEGGIGDKPEPGHLEVCSWGVFLMLECNAWKWKSEVRVLAPFSVRKIHYPVHEICRMLRHPMHGISPCEVGVILPDRHATCVTQL
jgi:hypothetical protein